MFARFLNYVVLIFSLTMMVAIAEALPSDPTLPKSDSNLYFELNAGYAWAKWNAPMVFQGIPSKTVTDVSWDNKNHESGFSYGVVAGYNLLDHASVEAGFINLPSVSYKGDTTDSTGASVTNVSSKINTWLLYGAVKLNSSSWHRLSLFTKAGLAYHFVYDKYSDLSAGYVEPIFSLGTNFSIASNWYSSLEYTYVGGESKYTVPQSYLLRLGVGFIY